MDIFQTRALLGNVFSFLPPRDLCVHLARVCRRFQHALLDAPLLWSALSQARGWGPCSRRTFLQHLRAATVYARPAAGTDLLGHSAGVVLLYAPPPKRFFEWRDGRAVSVDSNVLVSGGSAPTFEFRVWDLAADACVRDFRVSQSSKLVADIAWSSAQLGESVMVFARAQA